MDAAVRTEAGPEPTSYLRGNLWSWLTTVDHKRIAVLYGASALAFFLIGGIEALLIRIQLARPDNTFLSAAVYNQLFTMHGTTMIFLVVMPLALGLFANFAVPLLIGARDVAFPRINALSFWLFLFGALLLHASFFFHGAPDAGWFGYANLTERYYSPGTPLDFWVVSLLVLGISTLLSGVNFAITIINLRAPGMTFMRMPIFVWTILVTVVLVLLAFPALTVALIFSFHDVFRNDESNFTFAIHVNTACIRCRMLTWRRSFLIRRDARKAVLRKRSRRLPCPRNQLSASRNRSNGVPIRS